MASADHPAEWVKAARMYDRGDGGNAARRQPARRYDEGGAGGVLDGSGRILGGRHAAHPSATKLVGLDLNQGGQGRTSGQAPRI